MADINANLIKARDGAAPQHKIKGQNRFEATEGSNGALHTKIVDSNGNPLSVIPTRDSEIKSELEQIKQTQSEILQRLNEPIPTQLTGSIGEYDYNNNVEVLSGATVSGDFFSFKNTQGATKFSIGVDSLSTHNFEVKLVWKGESGGILSYRQDTFESSRDYLLTDMLPIKATEVRIDITNKSESDRVYRYIKLFTL